MNKFTIVIFFNDIAVDVTGVNAGGGESATLALAKALHQLGHKIIACGNFNNPREVINGIEYLSFGPNYEVQRIIEDLKNIGPYFCISSTLAHPFLFLQNHKDCLGKIILNHSPSSAASGLEIKTVFNLIDHMIFVSEAQRELIIQDLDVTDKTSVIKNGFDPDIFTYSSPQYRESNHVTFIGRIEVWKGAHLLFEIFKELKKQIPDLKLSMFGEYSKNNPVGKLAQKIKDDEPNVIFHGKVSQITLSQYLRKASLLVFSLYFF